jgi:RNA polymerase sigma-70 factor (ECF subfamily)
MNRSIHRISHTDSAVLVERFQAGEIEAFDEIVHRYRTGVYTMAYYFTQNREDAYDISQEVFLKVFMSLSGLRRSSIFDVWLRKITVNTSIDYLRKRPDEETLDISSYTNQGYRADDHRDLSDSPMEMAELRGAISKAIGRLPKRQKTVFVLRHYEDLSLKEIARTLRCPLGTVKANLFHATRRLRKLLSHYI